MRQWDDIVSHTETTTTKISHFHRPSRHTPLTKPTLLRYIQKGSSCVKACLSVAGRAMTFQLFILPQSQDFIAMIVIFPYASINGHTVSFIHWLQSSISTLPIPSHSNMKFILKCKLLLKIRPYFRSHLYLPSTNEVLVAITFSCLIMLNRLLYCSRPGPKHTQWGCDITTRTKLFGKGQASHTSFFVFKLRKGQHTERFAKRRSIRQLDSNIRVSIARNSWALLAWSYTSNWNETKT